MLKVGDSVGGIYKRTRNDVEEWYCFRKYIPVEIHRDKRQSRIKENAKMIRRLLLKFY